MVELNSRLRELEDENKKLINNLDELAKERKEKEILSRYESEDKMANYIE